MNILLCNRNKYIRHLISELLYFRYRDNISIMEVLDKKNLFQENFKVRIDAIFIDADCDIDIVLLKNILNNARIVAIGSKLCEKLENNNVDYKLTMPFYFSELLYCLEGDISFVPFSIDSLYNKSAFFITDDCKIINKSMIRLIKKRDGYYEIFLKGDNKKAIVLENRINELIHKPFI